MFPARNIFNTKIMELFQTGHNLIFSPVGYERFVPGKMHFSPSFFDTNFLFFKTFSISIKMPQKYYIFPIFEGCIDFII